MRTFVVVVMVLVGCSDRQNPALQALPGTLNKPVVEFSNELQNQANHLEERHPSVDITITEMESDETAVVQPPRKLSEAEEFAKTIDFQLGEPSDSIVAEITGRSQIPAKMRRQGEQRFFTWTFPDESQITLAFIPNAGINTGLKLHFVDKIGW